MATTHYTVVPAVTVISAVSSVQQDIELAHRTATLLVRLEPRRDCEQVVHDLLAQLKDEKASREARGLNHWSEHAPKLLGEIVRQARREKLRRYAEAEAFFRARHREIVRFARAIVMDDSGAEIVASDTYRELLEGGATIPGFFAALVCNARDYMDGESYRRGKFTPLDEAFTPGFGNADASSDDGDISAFEPLAQGREDQDPLDVLIAREEEVERQRLVAAAKADPRWRYIKRRDWAAPLAGNVRN